MDKLPDQPITTVVAIKGKLRFPHGYCSGAGEGDTFSDHPLRRNLDGEPELEGKSIAGALYHHLRQNYPGRQPIIDLLFGRDDKSLSSPLQVEHLRPTNAAPGEPGNLRDGVNLRRDRDSARSGRKYDYETSVRGLEMVLRLRLELRRDCPHRDELLQLLATLLRDLEAGRCRFGGRTGVGFGQVSVNELQARQIDLPAQFPAYLLSPDPAADTAGEFSPFPGEDITLLKPETETLTAALSCRITAAHPLLIQDGGRTEAPVVKTPDNKNETETDAWPVTLREVCGNQVEVITGPGTRGLLRTRCEKILRSLRKEACDPGASACEETIKQEIKTLAANDPDYQDKRKRIINAHSCPTCRIFGNRYRRGRVTCSDTVVDGSSRKLLFSVPLNRFTGGPGNLFNRLPLLKGDFTLKIEARNLGGEETTLLLLALRDLADNESIPLRFGGGRRHGYGRVSTKTVAINDENAALTELLTEENRKQEWENFLE
ncbi:MAG: hypothetical protein DRH04_00255 [Deltaproteobacteria bacterium]|nr:MAG: hypothetical protein DRH04_00255 [Deltaproteobacteria bacterium]